MPFVKIDCGMLNSTIWMDREAREVFITALLMAEPIGTDEPMEQIEVRTLKSTGWVVPPGAYGFVPAAGVGIVRQAGIEPEAGLNALERLGNPESDSRNPAWDGRRLVRVNHGYIVLNYDEYRARDYTAAERQRRYREKSKFNKGKQNTERDENVTVTRDVTLPSRQGTVTSRMQSAECRVQSADAHPNPKSQEAPAAPAGRKVPRGTRIPEDFALTQAMTQFALNEGLAPQRTFDAFCDFWNSKPGPAGTKLDWLRTWQTWCRTSADRLRNFGGGRTTRENIGDAIVRMRREADEAGEQTL